MHHPIEIYTKIHCPYCLRAKELLRIKGAAFVEYVIDDDTPRTVEMQRRSGRQSVPEIFINNRCIGGCIELFELDEDGRLDRLLTVADG
jgi:glutaredoxin 3